MVPCDDLLTKAGSLLEHVPATAVKRKMVRDGVNSYHITVVTPDEMEALDSYEGSFECMNDLIIIGIAHVTQDLSDSWSLVVCSPALQKFRASLGLWEKDFHVTVGFHHSDPHESSRSRLVQNISNWLPHEELIEQFLRVIRTNISTFDLICDAAGNAYPLTRQQVQTMGEYLLEHISHNGTVSSIDCKKELGKLALMAHLSSLANDCAISLLSSGYLLGLRLLLNSELQLHNRIHLQSLDMHLPADISATLAFMDRKKVEKQLVELNKLLVSKSFQSVDKTYVVCLRNNTLELLKLPRNFSWVGLPIVPVTAVGEDQIQHANSSEDRFLVAGCAFPSSSDQIVAAYFIGIRHVFTIHEGALPVALQISGTAVSRKTRVSGKKDEASTESPLTVHQSLMQFTHIACNDRTPPTLAQMRDAVIPAMHEHIHRGEGVLVHCLGGLGRTNTVIIAYLMFHQRISAAQAIEDVTRQRRIILSESQRGFLREWYRVVSAGFSVAAYTSMPVREPQRDSSTVSEENAKTSTMSATKPVQEITAKPDPEAHRKYQKVAQALKLCPVLMLCGLPSSGKSTFSQALLAAQPMFFTRINRDEMRGKGECSRVLAKALQPVLKLHSKSHQQQQRGASHVIILDNCHLTPQIRKEWLDSVHRLPTICVYFDREMAQLKERITVRTNHPTIPAGPGGIKILDSLQRQWQPPTAAEGFQQVIRISNDEEMAQILQQWQIPFVPPSSNLNCADHSQSNEAILSGTVMEPAMEPLGESSEEDAGESSMKGSSRSASSVFLGDKPVKFPRTAHAINLGAATRDDKVMSASDLDSWISRKLSVIVEEKVDGANLGFHIRASDGRIIAQNRSHYISAGYHAQFAPLDKWIARHTADLWQVLEPDRHILYGEWMHATHSVAYDALPDYFIAYDLYDVWTQTFLPRSQLQTLLAQTKIVHVPLIYEGVLTSRAHLQDLVYGPSAYGAAAREGIVIRLCEEDRLQARAKLVRPDFIAGNERWNRSSKLLTNVIRWDEGETY